MKILYHHRIASKDGQYVHIESIINELKLLGHEIIIVAPSVAEVSDFGSDGGWISKLRSNLPKFISELLEFGYAFYDFFKVCKAVIKYKPDVIYERYNLFLPSGIWVKKLFNLPLVLEVNSPLLNERLKYGGLALPKLAMWSEYYAWRNADKVFPVTHVLASYIKKAGVPESKIKVIPNGVDQSLFPPKQINNRRPEFQNKLVVGFVGFCREWHQLDQVMRLLAEQKRDDLLFLLVGDGPVIEDLKSLASAIGFSKHFITTGLIPRDQMPYWLDQIDIALQPAVTPWASPLKVLEYMAKELCIIAPDSPNIKELLNDTNSVLFEHKSLSNMEAALKSVLNNDELRKQLSTTALATIEKRQLTWRHNALQIVNAIKEVKQKE